MIIRSNTVAGEYVITSNANTNFEDGYIRIFYTKNIDPITSIVTAPEYAQLEAIYAETGVPASMMLILDQEVLVGQAPNGRKMYAITRDFTATDRGYSNPDGAGVRWTDGVGEALGQTTFTVITRTIEYDGKTYTGEAGNGNYWNRVSGGGDWRWEAGNGGTTSLIATRYYTYDNDIGVNLVTPDEFATLALDTYQSPALSFNTSSSDIQVGTWTNGQPLYKRSYEFSTTLVSGEELWRDVNTEQSVKGDIVLFEGAGSTIRSYDDSAVFVELTPQVGIDQRIATIVGGGITNSIIDRYFIKTDETAADIDQIVGIPDADSDGTLYGRQDGGWVPVTGGSSGGASELDDLSDVNTSNVALGDVLVYGETGSVFVPRQLAAADISDFTTAVALAAPVLSVTGGTDISVVNVGANVFQVSYTGTGTGVGGGITSVNSVTDGNSDGNIDLTASDVGAAATSHTHTASDVTDFDTEVDARIDVKDLAQGTNVTITESSGTYTINASGGSGSVAALDDIGDVPSYVTGDAQKMLMADNAGTLTWEDHPVPSFPGLALQSQLSDPSDAASPLITAFTLA